MAAIRKRYDPRLYFILDPSCCAGRDVGDVARDAARGGVTLIQLRNKADSVDVVRKQAVVVREALRDTGVPLIINDYADIAADIGADGVHIGQGDLSPEAVRDMIGDDRIVGLTAFTAAHFAALDPACVDYVGTGPIFPTQTDKGKPVLGVSAFAELVHVAPVPVVGIGGITQGSARTVIDAGAHGVAIMRAIGEAEDVARAAIDFRNIL